MSHGSVGASKMVRLAWPTRRLVETGRDKNRQPRSVRTSRIARYRKVHWLWCIDKNTKAKKWISQQNVFIYTLTLIINGIREYIYIIYMLLYLIIIIIIICTLNFETRLAAYTSVIDITNLPTFRYIIFSRKYF